MQKLKDEYEAKISSLTTAKTEAEAEARENKEKVAGLESKNRDQATKITSQTKEIENLKKDLAKV